MSKALDAICEEIKKGELTEEITGYLQGRSEMGKKVSEARLGEMPIHLLMHAVEAVTVKAYGKPGPVEGMTIVAIGQKEMGNIIYSAMMLGIGLAIDEELR